MLDDASDAFHRCSLHRLHHQLPTHLKLSSPKSKSTCQLSDFGTHKSHLTMPPDFHFIRINQLQPSLSAGFRNIDLFPAMESLTHHARCGCPRSGGLPCLLHDPIDHAERQVELAIHNDFLQVQDINQTSDQTERLRPRENPSCTHSVL